MRNIGGLCASGQPVHLRISPDFSGHGSGSPEKGGVAISGLASGVGASGVRKCELFRFGWLLLLLVVCVVGWLVCVFLCLWCWWAGKRPQKSPRPQGKKTRVRKQIYCRFAHNGHKELGQAPCFSFVAVYTGKHFRTGA